MNIAIIGSGISGLSAAYLLNHEHQITVYEKQDYLGGHSRTVDVKVDGQAIPIDTGFIVFNNRNYPNLTSLFERLNVPIEKSNMSFGVSINQAWLEYGTHSLVSLFAQKRNLLRFKFFKMLSDIKKFNATANRYLDSHLTLEQCLAKLGLGQWFRDYYLLPMGASIWSTPTVGMLDFPAKTFIQFFANHGLLSIYHHPQWCTVRGGSKEYINRLTASFKNSIKGGIGVERVTRQDNHVELIDTEGQTKAYDEVIFACHSNQVLNLLTNPTKKEKALIGAINYQPNHMVLHSDTSFMQKNRKAWSSWVYLSEKDDGQSVSLSYWMNNLQPLETDKPIIVTLNPGREPDPEKIYDRCLFHHPVFTQQAIEAQATMNEIQGIDRLWYAGAWQRYGFHEDGLLSAINIAEKMKVRIPWK